MLPDLHHEVGGLQAGGEEVKPAGLVAERAAAVGQVEPGGVVQDHLLQLPLHHPLQPSQ